MAPTNRAASEPETFDGLRAADLRNLDVATLVARGRRERSKAVIGLARQLFGRS